MQDEPGSRPSNAATGVLGEPIGTKEFNNNLMPNQSVPVIPPIRIDGVQDHGIVPAREGDRHELPVGTIEARKSRILRELQEIVR